MQNEYAKTSHTSAPHPDWQFLKKSKHQTSANTSTAACKNPQSGHRTVKAMSSSLGVVTICLNRSCKVFRAFKRSWMFISRAACVANAVNEAYGLPGGTFRKNMLD